MNCYNLSVGLGSACTILPTEHLAYSTIYTATHYMSRAQTNERVDYPSKCPIMRVQMEFIYMLHQIPVVGQSGRLPQLVTFR